MAQKQRGESVVRAHNRMLPRMGSRTVRQMCDWSCLHLHAERRMERRRTINAEALTTRGISLC
jgi:hypothetical protein